MPLPPEEDIAKEMGWQRWKDDGQGNLTKIKNFKLYRRYGGHHIKSVYQLQKKEFIAWLEEHKFSEVIWVAGYRSECVVAKFLKEKTGHHVEIFMPKMWVHDKWYRTPGWAFQFLSKLLTGPPGKKITVKDCLDTLEVAPKFRKPVRGDPTISME